MKIARTAAIDWLRRTRKVEALDSEEHQLLSDDPGPERAAAVAEAHRQVSDAVTRLPGEHREVLYLRFVGGLSYAEMAEWLGVPLTTIKWRMHRGLELVRDEVEKAAAAG
jgi:RNA polymerase sigma-70 factor (ECF subfamily)